MTTPKTLIFKLSTPIQNYNQMQHSFFFGLAIGKHPMGSGEPLGSPMPEFPDTHESGTILDGPGTVFEHILVLDRKRKRGSLMEEEISVLTSMTEVVKEVATAIRESKSIDVHPDIYIIVMDQGDSSQEALMDALSHLLDNKAQGVGFVAMADAHKVLWLKSWLGKHYC